MFGFFTKNRKGFTVVELLVVLVLLSFGVLALANMFKVTYRAFEKAEERSIKQEAVKLVAESLRSGQTNVASAASADIFATTDIICPTKADDTYSYLYFEPNVQCKECKSPWDFKKNMCSKMVPGEADGKMVNCSGERAAVDGFYIECLNKGINPSEAFRLSDVPIYVEFTPIRDFPPGTSEEKKKDASNKKNQCGVLITLSALEDDFEYEEVDAEGNPINTSSDLKVNKPISDDKYYSLTVAYHFPNMALAENGVVVNFKGTERSQSNVYNLDGTIKTKTTVTNEATGDSVTNSVIAEAVDTGGVILRVYSDSIISADKANTKVTAPSTCFIATASYGHDSGEVGLLCKFRDECLLTNPLGTAFVNAYYKLSPPVAEFISDSEPLKAAVRVALKPLVAIATNALDEEAASQNAPWFIVFMLCGAGATATLIKVNKRKKKITE